MKYRIIIIYIYYVNYIYIYILCKLGNVKKYQEMLENIIYKQKKKDQSVKFTQH